MSDLTDRRFWVEALDRAVRTFAQALAALLVGDGVGVTDVDWLGALSVAGLAAVVSVLTSVADPRVTGAPPPPPRPRRPRR